ncbi:hypothetical protein ASTA108788_07730 [Asticcacaulis taihuensis]|uniref:Uncharacterized protein n=2 Tax=Asticcacaulis taihuensis TaxID=260084 RepID=A0A1G4S293_9CAUL|nr:hypothetical protein SAMN02927928_2305 [Asticcacaulis taihuensis]
MCRSPIAQIYPPAKFPVHPIRMSQDNRTAQEHLSPEERRKLLRAFADRMLLKVTAMDDPEDLPGVEKAVRTAAMIERIYSRCDRAERQTTEPRKVDAERATHEVAAIKAQVSLASTLKWSEERRRDLGQWWEAAANATKAAAKAPVVPQTTATPEKSAEIPLNSPPSWQKVTYTDMTEAFEAAGAELALQKRAAAKSAQVPRPPFRGPP